MEIQHLHSIQEISKQYNTGDLPVLVLCSDTQEWAVPTTKIENKVDELFSQKWINDTWENFVECLKSYSNYGK